MPDVLIYGDTIRHVEMRHEVPLVVPDPFLYAETGGERHVVVSSLESSRIAAVDGGLRLHPLEEFGYDDLVASGLERGEVILQVMARACESLGLGRAVVPSDFPVELADRVRWADRAGRAGHH
jgi:Xaa-Pro aminopeptidase